jgi:Lrp/AsnC family leucine-responsive transcriptional regulator
LVHIQKLIDLLAFETKMNTVIDLDDINRDLIDLLQYDARLSYRELGERIGLSPPAIADRVRKLEESGVITGYRAVVDYEALGFPLLCIIRIGAPGSDRDLDTVLADTPEVIEANRVTGSESHVIRARLRSTQHLEEMLREIWEHGSSETNIVTSSPVERRPMNVTRAIARAGEWG